MQGVGTMIDFFEAVGVDFYSMPINDPISIDGWEVLTLTEDAKEEWHKVTKIVKKPPTIRMEIVSKDHALVCAPEHEVLVKQDGSDVPCFEEVGVLFGNESTFKVMTAEGWQSFEIVEGDDLIDIADIEVEGVHSYLGNGIVSHNTLYGDPTVVPGGMAVPYASSVRIKLGNASPLEKEINGQKLVFGVQLSAKTIKNKVARPFRSCDIEIHFGKGVFDGEQTFDYLRNFCEKTGPITYKDNIKISIEGTGAWKYFKVYDEKTGELVVDAKFHKTSFDKDVLFNPAYKSYVDVMMDKAYIMGTDDMEHPTFAGTGDDTKDADKSIEDLEQ